MNTAKPEHNQPARTLPEGWREVKLGEVVEIIGGGTPKTSIHEYWDGNIPWLTPPDFVSANRWAEKTKKSITQLGLKHCSTKLLHQGDIIISARGTVGALAQIKKPMAFSQSNYGLRAKDNVIEINFLFYIMKSCIRSIKQFSYGTVFDTITTKTFNEVKISLPPLPEQKAIAEVLSSLDDKIDLLHRQNKTLENMAQAMFRQWFIEEADESWEIGKIPDEFDFIMGQSPPGKSYNEDQNGIPMFQGNADFGFRFPSNRIYTTQPKRFAEKYDTLISVRAPVGEQNMAKEKCCIGRGVAAFRYKNNNSFYTYSYFKMRSLLKIIKQYNQTGTVFGSISKSDFQSMKIIIPPIELIGKFQEVAKPIDDKIISNQLQIRTLENLRDTLLPKLMSGKIKVNMIRGYNV